MTLCRLSDALSARLALSRIYLTPTSHPSVSTIPTPPHPTTTGTHPCTTCKYLLLPNFASDSSHESSSRLQSYELIKAPKSPPPASPPSPMLPPPPPPLNGYRQVAGGAQVASAAISFGPTGSEFHLDCNVRIEEGQAFPLATSGCKIILSPVSS